MSRRWALVISVAILAALLLPGGLSRERDSFPLSLYPMYANDRPSVIAMPTAVLRTADSERHRLSMQVIGDTDDPLIASALLRDVIAAGEAHALCVEIAERLNKSGTIEVVMERHDLIAFAEGSKQPLDVVVHASCQSVP